MSQFRKSPTSLQPSLLNQLRAAFSPQVCQTASPDLVLLQVQAPPKRTGFDISQVGSTEESTRADQRSGVQTQQTGVFRTSQNGAKPVRTSMQCRHRSAHVTWYSCTACLISTCTALSSLWPPCQSLRNVGRPA